MKRIVAISFLVLFGASLTTIALAVKPDRPVDRSGVFECRCATNYCTYGDAVTITYDHDRQWIVAEGNVWKFSGYVSREESKTTGVVHLVLPKGYAAMTNDQVFTIQSTGEVMLNGEELSCKRI